MLWRHSNSRSRQYWYTLRHDIYYVAMETVDSMYTPYQIHECGNGLYNYSIYLASTLPWVSMASGCTWQPGWVKRTMGYIHLGCACNTSTNLLHSKWYTWHKGNKSHPIQFLNPLLVMMSASHWVSIGVATCPENYVVTWPNSRNMIGWTRSMESGRG